MAYELTLGVVPIKRTGTNMQVAVEQKELILAKLAEITPPEVRLVNMEGVLDNGILYDSPQLDAAEEKLRAEKVDAIFVPHCDFGCEEVVGRLTSRFDLPVLLWGNRDDAPIPGAYMGRDTQCGTLATSKVLQRYDVEFSYIINSYVDSEMFRKGYLEFCATANVVRAFRHLRILQVGSRPKPFFSVIYNEDELMTRFGIEIVTETSYSVIKQTQDVLDTKDEEWQTALDELHTQFVNPMAPEDTLEKLAAMRVAIRRMAKKYNCNAVSLECWTLFPAHFRVTPCQVIGALNNEGLPTACETDTLGAVSSVLLRAATFGREPILFADLTIRDPEDDNAELLWHCGPFPYKLKDPDAVADLRPSGQAQYRLKKGHVTIARFDAMHGQYSLFSGEGDSVDGPAKTGNSLWLKVKDWEEWEEKIVFGPYIHHVAGVYGDVSRVLHEACRYMKGVRSDAVEKFHLSLGRD